MIGSNKELVEMAEKVSKKLKREVEEKGLKLSISDGEKQGESKAITSCKHLEDRLQEWQQERMNCFGDEC